jgi:hypothetical protein
MKPLWLLAAALLLALPAWSWPVLSEGRQTPGGWCYRDHEQRDLWWLFPVAAEMNIEDRRPDIHLTVYHYMGTSEMGDLGDDRSGAILQFGLTFPRAAARLTAAKQSLGDRAQVRPLPLEAVEAEVVFAGINSTRAANPEADDETDERGTWKMQRFFIGLTPQETDAVTQAWEAGSIIISVNLVASARVCQARPTADIEPEPVLEPVLVDSIPVTLDTTRYPDAVKIMELDATMPAGYTALEIGCSELANSWGYSDLSMVVVVVEAEAMNGDIINRTVRFSRNSASTQLTRFDRAVRLSSGYVLRVGRVYASGNVEEAPPRRVSVWQGYNDVCAIKGGRPTALDPRMLY